jgi:uroporphyrinogen decarboxylase
MTGKERVLAAICMQETDRTPVFPITHYFTAGVKGVPISRFATNGDTMGSALIAGLERFEWDGINPGCDVAVEGEALGSTLDFPENAPLREFPENRLYRCRVRHGDAEEA